MKGKPSLYLSKPDGYSNVGKYHGSGMPTKYGTKKGGFLQIPQNNSDTPKEKPPRKMN